MKKLFLFLAVASVTLLGWSQNNESGWSDEILPKGMTDSELRDLVAGRFQWSETRGIEIPPPFDNLRNMAEWEEIRALNISWTAYPGILKQIVQYAMEEVEVIILSENVSQTQAFLENPNTGLGAITNFDNITILEANFDSVWCRDYSANPVYGNEVDDLVLVDWMYNRPSRPNDDASPSYIADYLGLDLYCMTQSPSDLVNTGGNWMTDGFGNAFASKLILSENEPGNEYGVSVKSEEEIEAIVQEWLGVNQYVKMETLPYDHIHHIDMHMKLLDEKRLLVGEFPETVSDGPQIQANMEFVLSNFTNKWGEPYEITWIPMPPTSNGGYPNGSWSGPAYRTYTNSVFVNNTIIIPTYREEYDTTAFRIYNELFPGYNIVGIDSDDSAEPIIFASGSIHCITHSVGVEDPLLISHNQLEDTESTSDYTVNAYINHRSGVASATLYWRLAGDDNYQSVSMSSVGNNEWEASIPGQEVGSMVQYYVHGQASNGKMQNRPMPAPDAYWDFEVVDNLLAVSSNTIHELGAIYPNPASAITVVPVSSSFSGYATITVIDQLGRTVLEVFNGDLSSGQSKFFFDARQLASGSYLIVLQSKNSFSTSKLMVK